MDYFNLVLILIIVLLAGVCFKFYRDKKESEREATLVGKERDEYAELGKGLAEYNQKLQDRKNQAKIKILEMLGAKVGSHEVAKALSISGASARRYLDELENEGKIKQVGKSGKKVYYNNSLRPV